jgi:hypothetical protein
MFGVLIREGKGRGPIKNIGDYVQSIAQRQFLQGKDTCYVDIEELSDFESDEQVNLIMNGWFTWNCEKFLPPSCINPLFVSFHLTPPKEIEFFTPEITDYLKHHEPIGARDMLTMEMMKNHGIDSYFSGCLTMTLGKTYWQEKHDGGIYIVDPYLEFGGDKSLPAFRKIVLSIYFLLKNYRKVKIINKKFIDQYKTSISKISPKLDHLLQAATFYEVYSKRFSDDILLNADYLTVLVDNNYSNERKFQIADEMLRKYAKAKCVITSRLHVSFPCLSMGTKNIFVMPSVKTEEKDVRRYSGRLGGLDDTVTVLELKDGKLNNTKDILPQIISVQNFPEAKSGYKKYSKQLSEKVESFVSKF